MVWGFYCAIMLYDYSVSTNEGNNNIGFPRKETLTKAI